MDERASAESLDWVILQKPKKRRRWWRRRRLIGIAGVHAGMKAWGELPDATMSNGLHPGRELLVIDGELKIVDP